MCWDMEELTSISVGIFFPLALTKEYPSEKQRQQQKHHQSNTRKYLFVFRSRSTIYLETDFTCHFLPFYFMFGFSWDFQCEKVFPLHRHTHARLVTYRLTSVDVFRKIVLITHTSNHNSPLSYDVPLSLSWNIRAWLHVKVPRRRMIHSHITNPFTNTPFSFIVKLRQYTSFPFKFTVASTNDRNSRIYVKTLDIPYDNQWKNATELDQCPYVYLILFGY